MRPVTKIIQLKFDYKYIEMFLFIGTMFPIVRFLVAGWELNNNRHQNQHLGNLGN